MTKKKSLNRRGFMRSTFAGMLAAGAAPVMGSFRDPSGSLLANPLVDPMDFKITELKIVRLRFETKTPRKWNSIIVSGGGYHSMKYIEIHTNQGIVGRALSKGTNETLRKLGDKIRGENPFDVEWIWDKMYSDNRKPVAKGQYISAMGTIDIAVWDIIGKALNMPVYRVLGGHKQKIRVYAAGGYYEEGKTTADLVKEMEGYVAEGFHAVKMKVGGASFGEDVERVGAVRDAIGPDIDLLIDANNKWYAYEAIRFGKAIEKFNPFWFEEPVVPDDFDGCAEVRHALDIPVVAGENEFTRWGCRDLIQAGSADILNLDTVKAGGITEYRKIAALASAFHIPVAPHGSPHMAIHLLASTPNSLIMETYPGVESQFNPVLPLYPVKDGHVTVPDTPGIGIEPDPELVKKFKIAT